MSHSSNSSLLQQHRPSSLPPLLPDPAVAISQAQSEWLEKHEQTQQELCKSRSTDVLEAAKQPSPALTLVTGSLVSTRDNTLDAVPSTSSGLRYLNIEPIASQSMDFAVADVPSPFSETSDNIQSCVSLLAHAQIAAIGEAVSREKWQPDASSALCTFPLCTANFAQGSYFFLRHRRHHCRLCGQLFCGSHSSQRAPLVQTTGSRRNVIHARVCDMCLPRPESEISFLPVSPGRKLSASDSEPFTDPSSSSHIMTPMEETGTYSTSSIVLRSSSHSVIEQSSSLEVHEELGPIEDWMDKSGVLSLYPLAVNASHSRNRRSTSPAPAAAPLFGPSLKSRRQAKEKEIERQTLRQRRLGKDDCWLPKFPEFTEDLAAERRDDDDEDEVLARYRASLRVLTPMIIETRA